MMQPFGHSPALIENESVSATAVAGVRAASLSFWSLLLSYHCLSFLDLICCQN